MIQRLRVALSLLCGPFLPLLSQESPFQRRQVVELGTLQLRDVLVDTLADGACAVLAPGYKLVVTASTATFLPYLGARAPAAPLELRLQAIRRGDREISLHTYHPPIATAGRLTIDRGAADERWDLYTASVEQSFVVRDTLGTGDLVLTLAVNTELQAVDAEPGILFTKGGRALIRYGDVTTHAADGTTIRTASQWRSGVIELRVPHEFLERNPGPVVVDPVVSAISIDAGNDDTRNPDVAFDASTQRWLVVYERHFSANDIDILSRRYDRDGTLLDEVAVATGTRESLRPAVGSDPVTGQCLIAWDEDRFQDRIVLGRFRSSSSVAQQPTFTLVDADPNLENRRPSVSGTIDLGIGGPLMMVVCEQGVGGVAHVRVRSDGTVAAVSERALSFAQPRIQRSGALDLRYCVSEFGTSSLFVELLGVMGLGSSVGVGNGDVMRSPSIAGPLARPLTVFTARSPGGPSRLQGILVRQTATGSLTASTPIDLRGGEPGADPSRSQTETSVAFDGVRYTVAYLERQSDGTDRPFAVVFSLENDLPVFHAGHVPLSGTSADVSAIAMASEGEAGGSVGRSLIVFDRDRAGLDRDVVAALFEGRADGPMLQIEPSGCARPLTSTPTIATSGSPMLGDTLRLSIGGALGLPLFVVGAPGATIPLCSVGNGTCRLGVQLPFLTVVVGSTFALDIPTAAVLVGTTLALQGFDLAQSGACGGQLIGTPFAGTDIVRMTVR